MSPPHESTQHLPIGVPRQLTSELLEGAERVVPTCIQVGRDDVRPGAGALTTCVFPPRHGAKCASRQESYRTWTRALSVAQ